MIEPQKPKVFYVELSDSFYNFRIVTDSSNAEIIEFEDGAKGIKIGGFELRFEYVNDIRETEEKIWPEG